MLNVSTSRCPPLEIAFFDSNSSYVLGKLPAATQKKIYKIVSFI